MDKVKCFDVAEMVINEASSQFGILWKVDNEKLQRLKENCDLIDELSDDSCGVSFDAFVDEITMDISITLECEELIADNKDHVIYHLMDAAKAINLFARDGNLCIKLRFGSIWKRTI